MRTADWIDRRHGYQHDLRTVLRGTGMRVPVLHLVEQLGGKQDRVDRRGLDWQVVWEGWISDIEKVRERE
jgi:hypothetical protein